MVPNHPLLLSLPEQIHPVAVATPTMVEAALEEEVELSKEELEDVMAADWNRMQAGLRERRAASGGRAQGKDAGEDGEDDEDDKDLDEDDPRHTRRCAATSTALPARASDPGRSRVAGGACAPRTRA